MERAAQGSELRIVGGSGGGCWGSHTAGAGLGWVPASPGMEHGWGVEYSQGVLESSPRLENFFPGRWITGKQCRQGGVSVRGAVSVMLYICAVIPCPKPLARVLSLYLSPQLCEVGIIRSLL